MKDTVKQRAGRSPDSPQAGWQEKVRPLRKAIREMEEKPGRESRIAVIDLVKMLKAHGVTIPKDLTARIAAVAGQKIQ